jgi:adiponectin receptor
MFIILGLSAAAPMIYIGNYAPKEYIDTNTSVLPWALGGATYIGGALIFVFRIPERYFPKKFDCIGSSHQIFHVCVVAGCAIHFNDAMKLFR